MKRQILFLFICFGFLAALPGMSFASASETLPGEEGGWEEEYTDTDIRKGTLAVRCEVFQGFHGTVYLRLKGITGGRERQFSLTGESNYSMNLPLGEEGYRIVGLEAVSSGRRYECRADGEEFRIRADETVICQIHVAPNGVYQIPYDEMDEQADNQAAIGEYVVTGDQTAVGDPTGTGNQTVTGSQPKTEGQARMENQMEMGNQTVAESQSATGSQLAAESRTGQAPDENEESNQKQPVERENTEPGRKVKRGNALLMAAGLVGMTACLGGLYYVLKRSRRGE